MLENAVLICFHCNFSKNIRKIEKSRCQKHITDYLTRPIGQRPGEFFRDAVLGLPQITEVPAVEH